MPISIKRSGSPETQLPCLIRKCVPYLNIKPVFTIAIGDIHTDIQLFLSGNHITDTHASGRIGWGASEIIDLLGNPAPAPEEKGRSPFLEVPA